MADTLQHDDKTIALELGRLLEEHRGIDVVLMDLRSLNMWTDFFVLATTSSSTHVQGLQRHIKQFAAEKGVEILLKHKKIPSDDEWHLVDLGNIVVHLMSGKARSFYELERLWSGASILSIK